jgi:hypothetical protein
MEDCLIEQINNEAMRKVFRAYSGTLKLDKSGRRHKIVIHKTSSPMSTPITPDDAYASANIHATMIAVVNDLLKAKFDGDNAIVLQEDVVKEFLKREVGYNKNKLRKERHLDFEPLYEKSGWKVQYVSPAKPSDAAAYYKFVPNVVKNPPKEV